MRTRDQIELLSIHADGLNAGQDLAGDLLARRPEAAEALQPLLGLARRAQAVLRPVEPSAAFVGALKDRLTQPLASAVPSRPSWLVVAVAGLGGLISLASAVLLVSRIFSGGARRMRDAMQRPALPKMRAAH